jgi:hypothetical protein
MDMILSRIWVISKYIANTQQFFHARNSPMFTLHLYFVFSVNICDEIFALVKLICYIVKARTFYACCFSSLRPALNVA